MATPSDRQVRLYVEALDRPQRAQVVLDAMIETLQAADGVNDDPAMQQATRALYRRRAMQSPALLQLMGVA